MGKDKIDGIHRHALEEYPFECCGIIIGRQENNDEDILYPCTNIQNKLHEKDPEMFARDSKTAFYIDPKELMGILKDAENKGMNIKFFYHSHPDHDAYFSEEDKKMALFDDEPVYPGTRYLVVSVYDRKVKSQALFGWNSEKGIFEKEDFK